MSETKFTRGPWKVISEQAASEVEVFEIAEVSQYRVICDTKGDGFNLGGDAYCDARLIAAAPELLDAMRDLIGWFPGQAAWHTDEPIKALDRARAAIAKATGAK